MPEEIITGQKSENSQDGHPDAVEKNKEDTASEAEFTDEGTDDVAVTDESDKSPEPAEVKPKQTKEQNSKFARQRREAERQKELKETREKAIIEALGGKNPYTGGEIKDSSDIEEFLLMREIENKGGDPVSEFSKYHKERERARAEQLKQESENAEWYQKDYAEFLAKYPDVDIDKLAKDPRFVAFADGKLEKKIPLSEIYSSFKSIVGEYEQKAKAKAVRIAANKNATPGALSGAGNPNDAPFTKDQVEKMSEAEINKHYDKIMKSMKTWK